VSRKLFYLLSIRAVQAALVTRRMVASAAENHRGLTGVQPPARGSLLGRASVGRVSAAQPAVPPGRVMGFTFAQPILRAGSVATEAWITGSSPVMTISGRDRQYSDNPFCSTGQPCVGPGHGDTEPRYCHNRMVRCPQQKSAMQIRSMLSSFCFPCHRSIAGGRSPTRGQQRFPSNGKGKISEIVPTRA
jgi:hypothetical protein